MPTPTFATMDPELVEVVPGLELSHDKLAEAYQQYLERVPMPASGKPEDRFRRLGLTHRPNARDPWRDAGAGQFNQETGERYFEESEFSLFNKELEDTYFH